MLSRISHQRKIIPNWNFELKLFKWISIDGCMSQKKGALVTQKSLNIALSVNNNDCTIILYAHIMCIQYNCAITSLCMDLSLPSTFLNNNVLHVQMGLLNLFAMWPAFFSLPFLPCISKILNALNYLKSQLRILPIARCMYFG